jgi:hypothetical protein
MQFASRRGGFVDGVTNKEKPILVSKKEAIELLGGISMRTLDYMIARGDVRTVRLGKRRLVLRSEIDRIVRAAR